MISHVMMYYAPGAGMARRRWLCLLATAAVFFVALTEPVQADGEPLPGLAVSLENKARVQQIDATNAILYKGNADIMLLPGLLADRKRQRVEVMVESTGLSSNNIVEFLLISETSQHAYEALLVAFARPSDIHKALEFIGMKAGAPYDPRQLRMWPKGERVLVSLVSCGQGSVSTPLRIERLILDTKTGQTLPENGFVFTGSVMVPLANNGQEYGADAWEPKAVISIYNEPYSVLDIPRITHKSEVYGEQVVNPEFALDRGALFSLFLEPEYKDGRTRVKDLVLDVAPTFVPGSPGSNAVQSSFGNKHLRPEAQELTFRLSGPEGKALNQGLRPDSLSLVLQELQEQGDDAFVAVRFHPGLRLDSMRNACQIIADLDKAGGMRVEPPGPGQLYYRAFLVNQQWRQRENRAGQPWELVLSKKNGGLAGKLIQIDAPQVGAMLDPQFKITEFPVADAAALSWQLAADTEERQRANQRARPAVVLIFAEPDLPYGELTEFSAPLIAANYVVYVFLEKPAK